MAKYERQKKYQKKKASDPEFKRKESIRVGSYIRQKNAAMTEEEKEAKKKRDREYIAEYREKQKQKKVQIRIDNDAGTSASSAVFSPKSVMKRRTGFRSRPAIKRAVRKLLDQAPTSPLKRQSVVAEAAEECGLVVNSPDQNSVMATPSPSTSKSLEEETKNLVKDFYFQTNIVYTAPGLKDEMTVWEGGKKLKLRRYYLELTVDEVFSLFKEKYPNVKVGRSKFFELKPPNVLHMSKSPKDQCKCVTHENFRLLLTPFKINVDKDFWSTVICTSSDLNSACWKQDCKDCAGGSLLLNLIAQKGNSDELDVTWYTWESIDSVTKKGKEVKRISKVFKGGCMGELKELVENAWGNYVYHVRTKRIMSNEFQKDLSKENLLILQVDFAMDYNTQHNAKEVQSAIYGRQNVVIFTAAVRHEGSWKSYSVVTDSDKYKNTVRVCIMMIMKDFLSTADISAVDKFIIWSDGPSCEFRNQFCTGKLLFEMCMLVKKVSYWKYFAASHGKGVCDGIGGGLKARVGEHAKGKHRDNVMVQNYKDFYELGKKYCPKVTLFKLGKEDVETSTLSDKPWENVIPLPGVSSVHIAKCGLDGTIQAWKLPAEGPLKPIKYSDSVIQDQEASTSSAIAPEVPVPVEPEGSPSESFELVDRGWYVAQWEDGNLTFNYICQLIRQSDTDGEEFIVNSYKRVTSGKLCSTQRLFVKFPEEETASRSQFIARLKTPEFKPFGRVLFVDTICFDVK